MTARTLQIEWHPGLPIYASERFLRTVGDDYGWIGGIDEFGNLRCFLPYTITRKAFVRMARFRTETIPLAGKLTLEEEKSFLNAVVAHFRSAGVDMIIPATTNSIFRTFPDGAVAAPYGSYVIELRKDEESLLAQMSATHRKKLRHAMKDGVVIRSGLEYVDQACQIIQETLKRSSMSFMDLEAFRRLCAALGENGRLFVAERGGAVQGCTLFPFSLHSAYSLYGGSTADAAPGTMNLLNWEAIKLFRGLGVERFDFVGVRIQPEPGSKQEGIMTFKQRFGGTLKQGYLWKCGFHRAKYLVYSLAVRLLRGGDIVDQEKHKLKACFAPLA